MRLAAPLLICVTALATAAPTIATTTVPSAQAGALAPATRSVAGTSPAVAVGSRGVVAAWLEETAGDRRVVAITEGASVAERLGPAVPGTDGAPAAATDAGGSVWIVAARTQSYGTDLWAQQREADGWLPALPGPRARRHDHHPAVAADVAGGGLWAAWIGDDDGAGSAMLYASRWTGTEWTAAEPLPRTVGTPMAPSIAVTAEGTPVIGWAASDGTDAEIWVSTRRGGRWSSPDALTDNAVPDLTPSIAAVGQELLVAWVSYADDGYRPYAASSADGDTWGDAVRIADTPGSRPRAFSVDGAPAVLWRRLGELPGAGTISARVRASEGWGSPRVLAAASGSPFAVATGDAALVLAFARPDGTLALARGESGDADAVASLAGAAALLSPPAGGGPFPAPAAEGGEVVPMSYTAFGDSITNGVVYDPDRRDSPGYREALQELVRGFFGRGSVFNAGVDGETTVDGVGRIDNAIRAHASDAILIMEGTNDILDVIEIDAIVFNLRRMVQRSYEENPDILPFVAQIPPRLDPGPDGFDGPGNGRIDELNSLLPEIGEDEGAVIVDMNTPFDGHPALMSNPLHPSEAGYEVMAEEWYESIKPAVLERTNHGDVDDSGRTDGVDLVRLSLAFGAVAGEPRYSGAADINGDGIIDGFDLSLLIEFFGTGTVEEEEDGS